MGGVDALKNLLSGNGADDVSPGSQIRPNVSTSAPASAVVAAAEPNRVDAETNSPVKDNHIFRLGDYAYTLLKSEREFSASCCCSLVESTTRG